jgi:hypothetical protein
MLFAIVNGWSGLKPMRGKKPLGSGSPAEVTNGHTINKAMKAYDTLKGRVAFMAFSFWARPDAENSAVRPVNQI